MSNSAIIRASNPSILGQSVFTELTSAQAQALSAATWATISDGTTNMSLAITPTTNTSKILLFIDFNGTCSAVGYFKIQRNGVDINVGTGATGSQIAATGGFFGAAAGNSVVGCFKYVYLDSPASTSAQTYTIQAYTGGAQTLWVNRAGTDTDDNDHVRYTTRLIAIEVLV